MHDEQDKAAASQSMFGSDGADELELGEAASNDKTTTYESALDLSSISNLARYFDEVDPEAFDLSKFKSAGEAGGSEDIDCSDKLDGSVYSVKSENESSNGRRAFIIPEVTKRQQSLTVPSDILQRLPFGLLAMTTKECEPSVVDLICLALTSKGLARHATDVTREITYTTCGSLYHTLLRNGGDLRHITGRLAPPPGHDRCSSCCKFRSLDESFWIRNFAYDRYDCTEDDIEIWAKEWITWDRSRWDISCPECSANCVFQRCA